MAKYRRDRINEEMTHVLSEVVRQIKDPRVSRHFVSVIRCEVTPDLKYCKIFYSVLGNNSAENAALDPAEAKELKKGLISATGFIRRQIAQELNLRITPELQFIYDASIAYGAHISAILHTPEIKDDIRRFDERAKQEQMEAEAASIAAAEEAAAEAAEAAMEAADDSDSEDDDYDD